MKKKQEVYDVAVVGAGPAGMMAAITGAKEGLEVVLLDKNKELGKKLLLTGNGRCNLTNAEFNLRKLVENYGEGKEFLFHAFSVFGPKEVLDFFEKLGIKTKIEPGNRVFPLSGNAGDVIDALKECLEKYKVKILFDSQVSKVVVKENKTSGRRVVQKIMIGENQISAKKYIFCTGGMSYPATGSSGEALRWLESLGHKIAEPMPALVPLKIKEDWAKELQGLALKDVGITVAQNNKRQFQEIGDLLFTHFGLSGPVILDISRRVGELLKKGEVIISIDFYPRVAIVDLIKKISEKITKNPRVSVKNFLSDIMPQRLVPVFARSIGINSDKPANNITKSERVVIAKQLKQVGVTATGLMGFDVAMATSGGVLLKEVDAKTMKSKIIDNLYFAGEILGIDGKTGGFNLQACWSTGYLAGKSASL